VDDSFYVNIARSMYKGLQDDVISDSGISDGTVSSELRHAIRELRNQWVQEVIAGRGEGSQGITRLGRDGELLDIIETRKVPVWQI
jgi:hypothetical protein